MAGISQCDRLRMVELVRSHFRSERDAVHSTHPGLLTSVRERARRLVLNSLRIGRLLKRRESLQAEAERIKRRIESTDELIGTAIKLNTKRRKGWRSVEETIEEQTEAVLPAVLLRTQPGKRLDRLDRRERQLVSKVLSATKREQLDAIMKQLK